MPFDVVSSLENGTKPSRYINEVAGGIIGFQAVKNHQTSASCVLGFDDPQVIGIFVLSLFRLCYMQRFFYWSSLTLSGHVL